MRTRLAVSALLLVPWAWLAAGNAHGAVVILANRTERPLRLQVSFAPGQAREFAVASGDLLSLRVTAPIEIAFTSGTARRAYWLDPNAAYYFADFPQGLDLQEIHFGEAPPKPAAARANPPLPKAASVEQGILLTIPVKLLVDEEEPTTQRAWEQRLRKRLAAATTILEKHCHVRFEVVAVGTWKSDNLLTDFDELLRDFEGKTPPRPARLAIGFTSQITEAKELTHLGGTRGALHPHILIREWTPRTEPERLEVLLHELGHHLGAAHSPEPDSVMRPGLGDGKSIVRQFRIGFDPPNTLAMCLFADEIHHRGLRSLRQLSPPTRDRLRQIYTELARALPNDPVAAKYVQWFQEAPAAEPSQAPGRNSALVESTRVVLAALVAAAERNQRLPARHASASLAAVRLSGDRLTEYYVREAATAAKQLPADRAVSAFLLAVGLGLDNSDLLRKSPGTSQLCRLIESDAERTHRLAVLGIPTMHGRHDLTLHFSLSAALTVLLGPKAAEAVGLLKEQHDAQGGSGFSFADLCADLAGIALATRLGESDTLMGRLARSFTVADFVPAPGGLREGLSLERFRQDYGSVTDARFRAIQEEIGKRIRALPGYQ